MAMQMANVLAAPSTISAAYGALRGRVVAPAANPSETQTRLLSSQNPPTKMGMFLVSTLAQPSVAALGANHPTS